MNFEETRKLWNTCIFQYNSLFDIHPDLVNHEASEIAGYLKKIFLCLIKKAKVRDKWEFKWSNTHYNLCIFAMSEKQRHEYVFGIYSGDFYIKSYILEPQNIKLMTNEFWATLSKLDLIKNFSFQDNAVISEVLPLDIKTGKASVYRLIRNYILLEEHQPQSVIDLGWYQASWPLTHLKDDILDETAEVIKGIHKLNYLSYRRECQKKHSLL